MNKGKAFDALPLFCQIKRTYSTLCILINSLEARAGVEPTYTDLQSGA